MKKGVSASSYVTIILVIILVIVILANVFLYSSKSFIENITEGIKEKILEQKNETISEYKVDLSDYEMVNVSILFTNIRLISGCRMISFDVTDDQAYSIAKAIEGIETERPLTHDIFIDVLDNFGIKILAGMVNEFQNDIYHAKIYLKSGNSVLELDARPSDTIALLSRLNMPLYVKKSILQNSTNIC